eukprot:COSAG04_NODE_9592_length_849_cov_1.782667_2_plen_22_part_01
MRPSNRNRLARNTTTFKAEESL